MSEVKGKQKKPNPFLAALTIGLLIAGAANIGQIQHGQISPGELIIDFIINAVVWTLVVLFLQWVWNQVILRIFKSANLGKFLLGVLMVGVIMVTLFVIANPAVLSTFLGTTSNQQEPQYQNQFSPPTSLPSTATMAIPSTATLAISLPDWPTGFYDDFEATSSARWVIARMYFADSYLDTSIRNGQYSWYFYAKESDQFEYVHPFEMKPVSDFVFTIRIACFDSSSRTYYGVIGYYQDQENYFAVYIDPALSSARWDLVEDGVHYEMGTGSISSLKPSEYNTVILYANNGGLTLVVNNEYVGQSAGGRLKDGVVGLIVGIQPSFMGSSLQVDNAEVLIEDIMVEYP